MGTGINFAVHIPVNHSFKVRTLPRHITLSVLSGTVTHRLRQAHVAIPGLCVEVWEICFTKVVLLGDLSLETCVLGLA